MKSGREQFMTASHRAKRWLALAGSIVLASIIGAAGYTYFLSERLIDRRYDSPLSAVAVLNDSASIAEGERLAHISGCFGCHGDQLQGRIWDDDFVWGRLNAPNLPEIAREYSPAELARVIRAGVRPDGSGVMTMPSSMFYYLSDEAISRLVAFLRFAPVADGLRYEFRPGWAVRWDLVRGSRRFQPDVIAELGPRMREPAPGDTIALGRYIARTACTECHGLSLEGDWGPDLVVAAAYTPEEFANFMATGEASGGRELPVMSRVARGRFSHLTVDEVTALGAFLRERAAGREN